MQNQAGITSEQIVFWICGVLALSGAIVAVAAKNPIRGAMGLLLLILNVAGLFALLDAHFLAAIQLIVYAGAIVVLFLFVLMLLGPAAVSAPGNRGSIFRAVAGGGFGLIGLVAMALMGRGATASPMPNAPPGFGTFDQFGWTLFNHAVVPFELSAALLLVAVLGAVAIARGSKAESAKEVEA